jgi:hypothetical protein
VLKKVDRQAVHGQIWISSQRRQRRPSRGVAVHEDERQARPELLAQRQGSLDDHVEEAQPVLGLEQGFGLAQTHGRGQTAVELDQRDAVQRVGVDRAQLLQRGRCVDRGQHIVGQQTVAVVL